MLTLVGGNPSWHLGELYSFYKQRRMIRIVHTAADLWGKHIVNGPHNNNIRCKGWALRDSLSHVAWAWLQGGSIGGVGGGASHWLERASTGEGGIAPEVSSKSPQSSPAHQHQMYCRTLRVTSQAQWIFLAQLITSAERVQAHAKTSAACFIADALALFWAHLRCAPASGAALQLWRGPM